jgi:intron-binding protein aquarius
MTNKDEDVYGTFNLLVRRKPKENNFKAVLETIRDLMNSKAIVPEWLHDIFLGYGDMKAGKVTDKEVTINFNDTFLNANHLIDSFPGKKITFIGPDKTEVKNKSQLPPPPYQVKFPPSNSSHAPIVAQSYVPISNSPFPEEKPKRNRIPFTPTQVEAIRSGVNDGLTLVVGPPGTGKTDVAVQIISNLYHNFPNQRTLFVAHSNQALNQLFEKIMALDIDERHLMRLGHGEEFLSTTKDFSKYGRVNYMLEYRADLLVKGIYFN